VFRAYGAFPVTTVLRLSTRNEAGADQAFNAFDIGPPGGFLGQRSGDPSVT